MAKLSMELCQLIMEPVNPVRVKVPEFVPAHCWMLAPLRFPPTETPETETVNMPEVEEGQVPF